MRAGSRTVTGVIRTFIPVIGADRARRIKAAVRIFLTGIALRLRTGVSCVYSTRPATAGVRTVTVQRIIAGCSVIRITAAHSCRAQVIRTDIAIRAEGIVRCAVTHAARTGISFSTGYQVIAGCAVVLITAAHSCRAQVIRTDIAVRAEGTVRCAVTHTARTGVDFSTGYQVITGCSVVRITAARS